MPPEPADTEQLDLWDGHDAGDEASPGPAPLEVQVTRSARRKKTAQARLVGGVIDLRIPAHCDAEEEQHFIDHFRERFERSRQADEVDLEARAAELADEYDLPHPSSVRWVSNQRTRWGSCTPTQGTIRLSDRMAYFPNWVVDYVLLHELAHLVELNHTPEFWSLIENYPLAERARGYLIAKAETV